MRLGRSIIPFLILELTFLGFGQGCSKPKVQGVVARVGENEITVEDLRKALRQQIHPITDELKKSPDVFFKTKQRVLNDMIDKKLLFDEAIAKGTFYTEEELDKELTRYKSSYTEVSFQKMLQESDLTNEEWLQIKRQNFVIEQFLRGTNLGRSDFSEEEIKSYYDAHIEDFKTPESVHVRQIVTDSKEKAESILRRIQNGENFAKLARDLSLSPERKGGGDLGFISRGSFPREFEVCFSMNPGEISPIIPSVYGFHIFKVLEKKPAKTLELIEVQNRIVGQLKRREQQKALKELLATLRQREHIETNMELLKRIEL